MCWAWRLEVAEYDTIYLPTRAHKSWRNGQLSLAHGTETKNKEKLKKKQISREETVRAKVREGSPGRSETTEDRICETGRF